MNNQKPKGCVYFFRHVGLSPVKIGYSDSVSPIDRFNHLKTCAPYGAEILGFILTENAAKLELTLHRKFSNKRLKGEWFEISENEVNLIIEKYSTIEQIESKNRFLTEWVESQYTEVSKVKNKLPNGFIDFAETYLLNSRYENSKFRDDLKKSLKLNLSTSAAMNYLRLYCKYKKYQLIQKHSGSYYYFIINNN